VLFFFRQLEVGERRDALDVGNRQWRGHVKDGTTPLSTGAGCRASACADVADVHCDVRSHG
jgi:hypothetical protein